MERYGECGLETCGNFFLGTLLWAEVFRVPKYFVTDWRRKRASRGTPQSTEMAPGDGYIQFTCAEVTTILSFQTHNNFWERVNSCCYTSIIDSLPSDPLIARTSNYAEGQLLKTMRFDLQFGNFQST